MSRRLLFVLALASSLALQPALAAREDQVSGFDPVVEEPGSLPGVELAETVATATGIAITPLLGVSAVGAWQWYKAEPEARAQLPWYTSRWFWIPGLAIALLLVFKDPLLGFVPVAKKPLDALDVLENKTSAVLATPAVVPMFVSAFAGVQAVRAIPEATASSLSTAGLAIISGGDAARAFFVSIAAVVFLAAFFCVWLAFHAINVLILLSPFGPLDLMLRSIKLGVLVVLGVSTWIHPYLGALVSLLIVIAAIPVAAWSFRFTVFGTVVASDYLTLRHRRTTAAPDNLRAFVARRAGTARPRTYGRIVIGDSGLSFSYRPWLIMRRRAIELPKGSYRLGRGLICPLLRLHGEDGNPVAVLRLPPRYRYHEDELREILSLAGVDELPLTRGLRAIGDWLREVAGRGEKAPAIG